MANLTNNFIYHQNKEQNIEKIIAYFTLIDNHDFMDEYDRPRATKEDIHTVAKSVTTLLKSDDETHVTSQNDRTFVPTRFYIKIGLHGKIYNPIGLYSEGKNTKFLSKIGKKEFEYTEVNQKVFDMYINFLKSKNIAWLNNAEREMR